ncbi:hypothetical protein E2C01_080098 [Portunus trituberculatus]|uniref:Uncharacterized protein n=1 Tax=Portunus trituberculatus TaxID=210409 RepID=A0A5B7IXH8_PORTR|nr:hypothetical protein [Portunus trituberculatus]
MSVLEQRTSTMARPPRSSTAGGNCQPSGPSTGCSVFARQRDASTRHNSKLTLVCWQRTAAAAAVHGPAPQQCSGGDGIPATVLMTTVTLTSALITGQILSQEGVHRSTKGCRAGRPLEDT